MKTLGRIFYAPDGAGSGGSGAGGAGGQSGTPPPSSILGTPPPAQNPPPGAPPAGGSQTPPPAAVSFKDIVGEGGVLNDKWTDALPEDIRNDPAFKSIKTFEALGKSYLSAHKLVGAEKIVIPGKNATKEEREAFYNKLGRPETPDKYQFQKPENLPKELNWDDTRVQAFAAKAHEMGITQAQFAELVKYDTELKLQGFQQLDQQKVQAQDECVKELQKDWGNAFPQQLTKARRVAEMFGGIGVFEEMGVGDNPKMLKILADIGSRIGEDKILGADDPIVPSDAMAKISEIRANKDHAYWKPDHAGHAAAVKEMERLMAQAYPEKKG